MTNHQDQINALLAKLDLLLARQENFQEEINVLRKEIYTISNPGEEKSPEVSTVPVTEPKQVSEKIIEKKPSQPAQNPQQPKVVAKQVDQITPPAQPKVTKPKKKSDLEKFIGENLINKIGIIITIIGVAIGAKYSIEHELISPLTRIILGYFAGIGLLGFGMKLKKKYEAYSAVLVSGAIAILYFITYSAYSFYHLIPQTFAFGLMVVFTTFAVVAAINYNRQIIAHIGLVGAYAVPFLLSEGKGQAEILFGYMAIINIGILIIAFKKHWKPLNYSSFFFTWLIYGTWYFADYVSSEDSQLAFVFLTIFFLIFYTTFLAYKLIKKEKLDPADVMLILFNSFIFFGFGYALIAEKDNGAEFLGLFTLANAILHFIASIVIFKRKLGDKSLLYLVTGLVLVFITIAVPVQLDGNWVTLLWAGEAALLFWLGRTKNIPVYEKLSYILMVLACISLGHDWYYDYDNYTVDNPASRLKPLLNINFLSSLLFIAAFSFIYWLDKREKYVSVWSKGSQVTKLFDLFIPAVLVFTIFFSIRMEIATYWQQLFIDSEIAVSPEGETYKDYFSNYDLKNFRAIWIINFALFFVSILSIVNFKKLKNPNLGYINLISSTGTILVFLFAGLYALSLLRESYINQELIEYYDRGKMHIYIRYISFAFVALTLYVTHLCWKQDFMKLRFRVGFELILHTAILWIASSEMIHWLDLSDSDQSYKLGLSILWGVYSLLLIMLGIWKGKKYLRIGAIVLFGITLIKLFLYDISELNTIAKTIVFVSLGVLLLIISFLYNKYKNMISNETND